MSNEYRKNTGNKCRRGTSGGEGVGRVGYLSIQEERALEGEGLQEKGGG